MINSVNILDHTSVTVSDMDRSIAFYCDLIGLEEVERHRLEGETISKMAGKPDVVMQVVRLQAPDTPGIMLDLQQYIKPQGKLSDAQLGDVGHSHFCFGVPELMGTYSALKAKGVEFVSEPVSFDLEWGMVKVVFFKDPDGFVLELMEHPIQKKAYTNQP